MRLVILALRSFACLMLAGLILMPFAQIIMRSVFDVRWRVRRSSRATC